MPKINIRIIAGATEADASVEFSGECESIISDIERETFGIGDRGLKRACRKYKGVKPTDVYVKDPTKWDDVYHRYKWEQVKRILEPVEARVLGINKKPIIVSSREMENTSPKKGKFIANICHSVEETVSNSWTIGGELTVGHEINYSVGFKGTSLGTSTNLSFTGSWGNQTSKCSSVTLGSSSSVEVELEPGEAMLATLSATRGTLEVEVDYKAYLTGMVFANYHNEIDNHHFWAFPVEDVLEAAGLPEYVISTEKISVGFYTGDKIKLGPKKRINRW